MACTIKLIETFYKKLIQIVTFEKITLSDTDITESQWNQYLILIHQIHKFQNFIIELKSQHKEDTRFETHTFEKCSNYIAEVMVHAQTQAGNVYRKKNIEPFGILGTELPEFPQLEFF